MSDVPDREALRTGERLLQRGEHAEALSIFEAILRDEPDSVDALINLGVAALQAGDIRRGVDAHLKAFTIDPANEFVVENLSDLISDPAIAAHVRAVLESLNGTTSAAGTSADGETEDDTKRLPSAPNGHAEASTTESHPRVSAGPHSENPQLQPAIATPSITVDSPPASTAYAAHVEETPYSLSEYRVDRELKIVLKRDETIRDYVSLPRHLSRTDRTISLETLIEYLQVSFQKVAATFFNSTRLPEVYVQNIRCILQRMEVEHGITGSISPRAPAEFVFQIYHLLKEHLPSEKPTHRITIASDEETLRRREVTDDVRTLYRGLRTGFEPLAKHKLISLFAVHGSLSTLDFTPFSDVDTQLFLTEEAFASPELLLAIARMISHNNVYLRAYDPLQHHGYFVATDMDRRAYPEPFLPVATLQQSTRIFGDDEHSFAVRHVPYADRFAAWHMGHSFRLSYLSQQFPAAAFDVKRFMSRFALLPVLYLELVQDVYPYKGDVFRQWEDFFTPDQWTPFHVLTSARANWNPERGLHFSASFHRQVFDFAELLLDRLNERAHQDD